MSRFKNYGLWVSLAALIPMVCKGFGIDILPSNYSELTTAILGILVAAGIISNPKEGNAYADSTDTTDLK